MIFIIFQFHDKLMTFLISISDIHHKVGYVPKINLQLKITQVLISVKGKPSDYLRLFKFFFFNSLNILFMRKNYLVKLFTLLMIGLSITTITIQCKKEDTNAVINGLDRSFKGNADSTVFATFYSNNIFPMAGATPTINDTIKFRGVQAILTGSCGSANCHGGAISPKFDTYANVMKYVTPGNPAESKLWEYITTNNFNKAMPPISTNKEVAVADKEIIYNWILNGAKETPDLNDLRPAAVAIISTGCTSANCHNEATGTGAWARKGLLNLGVSDTTQFTYTNPSTGVKTVYCQLSNNSFRNTILKEYKDSIRKFYSDTLLNASFRPYKTFSTPVSASSTRGPFNNYDDIIFDINYPKGVRSNTAIVYTNPLTNNKYYVKGDFLNSATGFLLRIDSTLLMANPRTGVYGVTNTGSMAWDDGGLKPAEIALIKSWYFTDPNIPDIWKYGTTGAGIFKYKVSGKVITK